MSSPHTLVDTYLHLSLYLSLVAILVYAMEAIWRSIKSQLGTAFALLRVRVDLETLTDSMPRYIYASPTWLR